MDFDSWSELYKPLPAPEHLQSGCFDIGEVGYGIETYGKYLDYLKEIYPDKKFHIWTYKDSEVDNSCYIESGMRLCNRICYLITEKPFDPETHIQVHDC